MSRLCRWSPLLVVLTFVSGAASAPEPTLSLRRGADYREVMEALAGQFPVLAADDTSTAFSLGDPLDAASVEQALERVSITFDRHIIRRGESLVLQRRYSPPDDDPGLEIEELRHAAVEMDRLITTFAPRIQGALENIQAQARFVASITPEQERAMLQQGLPMAALAPEQRRHWLDINTTEAYTGPVREMRRARLALAGFERAYMQNLTPKDVPFRRDLFLAFPDPAGPSRGPGGQGEDAVALYSPDASRERRPLRVTGETLPRSAPVGERGALTIHLRRLTLPELAAAVQLSERRLSFPEYAAQRSFWLASRGQSRRAVLHAVADLWGWDLSVEKDRWVLGPPRPRPARDAAELHASLRRSVPPAVRHAIIDFRVNRSTERLAGQMGLVCGAADRSAGPGWRKFEVPRLDPTSRRRLANLVAFRQFSSVFETDRWADRARAWVLRPGAGVFTLTGPLGPDRHPTLLFRVPDDRAGNVGWGWQVGTAKTSPSRK